MYGPLKLRNQRQVATIADEFIRAKILGNTITINNVHASDALVLYHYRNGEIVRCILVGPHGGLKVEKEE